MTDFSVQHEQRQLNLELDLTHWLRQRTTSSLLQSSGLLRVSHSYIITKGLTKPLLI